MKLKYILLFSLIAFLNSCSNNESNATFHFGPGPRAEEENIGL